MPKRRFTFAPTNREDHEDYIKEETSSFRKSIRWKQNESFFFKSIFTYVLIKFEIKSLEMGRRRIFTNNKLKLELYLTILSID